MLAYATTIHKSQGSEYPIVVMPVMMNHYIMLQRNLIYTGITRAKKILVLVGTQKALSYAVRNLTVSKRNTMLKERIYRFQTSPINENTERRNVRKSLEAHSGTTDYQEETNIQNLKAAEPLVKYGHSHWE